MPNMLASVYRTANIRKYSTLTQLYFTLSLPSPTSHMYLPLKFRILITAGGVALINLILNGLRKMYTKHKVNLEFSIYFASFSNIQIAVNEESLWT